MINRNGKAKQHRRGACVGPLACHVNGFAAFLLREGYAAKTVKEKYGLTIDLSRWMESCKVPLASLDEEKLRQFQINRQRRCKLRHGDMWTARQILRYLRDLGCIPMLRKKTDRTALGHLTGDFEGYLTSERGLSRSTIVGYLRVVRRFLIDRFGGKAPRAAALCPRDIHRFVIGHLKNDSRSEAQKTVLALRCFLRFLHQRGAIVIDLAATVPAVANWRLPHLPRSLPPKQVKQLLASCDPQHTERSARLCDLAAYGQTWVARRRSSQHDIR